ncbi:peptidylprolyl isomerase [Bacteroidia bacterium]|nr:peptidylprolyl isomerase [Bacteroidia bacterium]GHV07504.1 peptidylprolyl isomerase [Bacteroidia bacterium]
MKKFLFLILFLTVWTQARISAQTNVVDEIVCLVGDQAILRSDVEEYIKGMELENEQITGDPYCSVLERMMQNKLYLHQAKLDSVDVSDSQVFARVESILNSQVNMFGSKEKLEEQFHKPYNELREDLLTRIKEGAMVGEVQRNLVKNVKITPADVRTFYNRIPQDSLRFIETTVEVQIITKEPEIAIEEIDEIKRRLREYTEQVNSGEKQFSALARLWSDDKSSAVKGGELGLQGKALFLPEFAAAAFDLNTPNRISRIVQTDYGYHIIQLIEKRGDRINVRHILLKPHVTKEELALAAMQMDSVRNDIVAEKFSFEEAAIYLSYDKETKFNKGLMVNNGSEMTQAGERTGTSHFEMSELPSEMAKVVDTMKVGDISKPFYMVNDKQKDVVAMVKLKSRTPGHKANLSDDFQVLRTMVEEEKQEEILKKWIAKKQKDTFIRIKDSWKNCDFSNAGWYEK